MPNPHGRHCARCDCLTDWAHGTCINCGEAFEEFEEFELTEADVFETWDRVVAKYNADQILSDSVRDQIDTQ